MKLSTKSRYALRSLICLAASEDARSISDISSCENISERYLELIFSDLRHAGILSSIRGRQGGYILAKPATDITIYDIVSIMEDDLAITRTTESQDALSEVLYTCLWEPINHNIEAYLRGITLQNLVDKQYCT